MLEARAWSLVRLQWDSVTMTFALHRWAGVVTWARVDRCALLQRLSWPAAGIVSQLARRWCFSIRSRFSTHSSAVGRKNGGPYWIRTSDFDDVNIALYQLS